MYIVAIKTVTAERLANLLQRGHADGGFRAVVVDPRLGEVVVVGRGEHAGEKGKRSAGSKRAPPHRLAVRRVLEKHRPVASVVGGLQQTSQQARLSDDKCHPVCRTSKG